LLEFLQAVLLGVVQGLTEFLPVSSSGHLLLGQYFLGLDQDRFGLPFDVALHLGTLVAVVIYFWRDLLRMAGAFVRSLSPGGRDLADPDQRLAYLILASTIPAALIGFFLEGFFEEAVRSPWVVVFNLVLVGVLFIVGEAVGSRTGGRTSSASWRRSGLVSRRQPRSSPASHARERRSRSGSFWVCAGRRRPASPS
jgi:undecaprenyl-diphosphatase